MLGKAKLDHAATAATLLVLAVLAVYLPVAKLDFTNYDDPSYITGNPFVLSGLTWKNVGWAFTHACSANWHPVTWISHMVDCQLFGWNPAGHHLTNLFFHTVNTVLLFLLLRALTGAFWRSACVAALFALHPMHVESVAWISERKDLLSAFFFILTLMAYAKYVEKSEVQSPKSEGTPKTESRRAADEGGRQEGECKTQEPELESPNSASRLAFHGSRFTPHVSRFTFHAFIFYLLSLSLFALGLMSKPMLVTLPCVLLLLDYWPLHRFGLKTQDSRLKTLLPLLLEKLPFFALAAASSCITILVQRSWGAIAPVEDVPLALRVVNVPVNYYRYLGKLVWPVDLAVLYPYVRGWPLAKVLTAVVVLVAVTLLALSQRNQRPFFLVGWAWFVGMLVPVIGLLQTGNQSIADRYTYLPAIGLFIIFAWGFAELIGASAARRALAAVAATALLLACALLSQAQVLRWQNTETLFRHALAVTTGNFVAYNSLGYLFLGYHELDQAKRCFRAALGANRACHFSWQSLGMALIEEGKYDEAIAHCQTALQLNPRMAEAQATLGLALMKQGKTNDAIAHYREALRLQPAYAPAHYNLANALAQQGQIAQAREHYQASLESDPSSADAHNNLAYMLAREAKWDQAASEFRSALALSPGLWQARYGLGDALARQGKYEDAAKQFSELLKTQPRNPSARLQLGIVRAAQGKLDEAVAAFSEALRSNPDFALAHYHLAMTLSHQGNAQEAARHYRLALHGLPNSPDLLNRLAWILASSPDPALRNGNEAVQLAERACQLSNYKQPLLLATLAASYAEAGRFPEALNCAENAQNLALAASQSELVARCREFLDLFRAGRPYHETTH